MGFGIQADKPRMIKRQITVKINRFSGFIVLSILLFKHR